MGIKTKQNLTTTNENSTNSENFLAEMQQVENEYVSKETAIKNNGISVANVVEKKRMIGIQDLLDQSFLMKIF